MAIREESFSPRTNLASQPAGMRPAITSEAIKQPAPSFMIVCDSPERLRRLLAAPDFAGVKITSCASTKEVSLLDEVYDLVIVDVETEQLVSVLKIIREKAGLARVPILVESSRLDTAHDLAGILPQYRAMACSHDELITLVHSHLAPSVLSDRPPRHFL
jgi:hypothetical protein